jgi:hypothetical protein
LGILDAVQIGNLFMTILTTRNYIHSQLFLTLCHIYTTYNLTRQYSTLFSRSLHNTLDIFTYSRFTCLFPIETSLVEPLFKTPLENWLEELLLKNCTKTANRFAYIAKTSENEKRSQSALLRQVTVFTTALPRKRACCRVTSSRPVAQEPYSNDVAWRHRVCTEILFTCRLPSNAL